MLGTCPVRFIRLVLSCSLASLTVHLFPLRENLIVDGIFLQQLINGLTLGSVYGLIAIGYTMVYGIIGMINFAHGDVYMVSAYLAAIGIALLSFFGFESFPFIIFGTLLFTIAVTGMYGYAIERIAYKPLRNSTRLAPLISAIGMSLILQNYVQISQGARQQGIPTMLDGALRFHIGEGFVQLTYTKLFIIVASIAGMLILTYIIKYTRLGRMCRATQQDRKMAQILGINTDRVISYVFVIGAAMAALAGVLITLNYGTFDFNAGFIIGIKAFTAAVLGGIGSLPGAMLGGIILGVAEAQFSGLVNSDFKDVFAFSLLVTIMIFRPQGLLGKPQVAKV